MKRLSETLGTFITTGIPVSAEVGALVSHGSRLARAGHLWCSAMDADNQVPYSVCFAAVDLYVLVLV